MSTTFCYDNVVFEERVKGYSIQVVVIINDKKAESSRTIFDKSVSLPVFVCVAFVLLPVVFLFVLVLYVIDRVSYLFKRSKHERSYEETKEYFKNGHGYLRNLSEEDKKKLLSRKSGLPLGL